jgi:hypothetical protein
LTYFQKYCIFEIKENTLMTLRLIGFTSEERLARSRQQQKDWQAANKEHMRQYHRKYYQEKVKGKDAEKLKARRALSKQIERGRLARGACEACGGSNAHGHHYDYTLPLDVVWLCEQCHRIYHIVEKRVSELKAAKELADLY